MNTEPIFIVKADGAREVFDVAKLEHSLKHAGASSKDVTSIVSTVTDKLTD